MSDPTQSNGAGPGEQPPEDASYRIRREGSGPLGAMGRAWRGGKWLRRFSYLCLAGLVGLAGIWIVITRDLPDASKLLRSEERRLGQGCVCTCRFWWSPDQ